MTKENLNIGKFSGNPGLLYFINVKFCDNCSV